MIFGEHPLKDLYRRALWGPGRRVLEVLPPPWEAELVRRGGRIAAAGLHRKRAEIAGNIARAFPELGAAERDALARQACSAHFANQYASFSFGRCNAENWTKYLRFVGLDHLWEAWGRGRGVVLAHAHLGPAQLPLHVLGVLGWPMHQIGGGRVTAVALSPTGRWAAAERRRLEGRLRATLHDGRGWLRPALRALAGGAVLMTACDATGGGEELGARHRRTVLGQPFGVPSGPARLAWLSGAPLLALACHSDPAGRPPYVAEISAEFPMVRDRGREAAVTEGVDHLAAWLDATLRAWPGDWLFWDGFAPGGLLPA